MHQRDILCAVPKCVHTHIHAHQTGKQAPTSRHTHHTHMIAYTNQPVFLSVGHHSGYNCLPFNVSLSLLSVCITSGSFLDTFLPPIYHHFPQAPIDRHCPPQNTNQATGTWKHIIYFLTQTVNYCVFQTSQLQCSIQLPSFVLWCHHYKTV